MSSDWRAPAKYSHWLSRERQMWQVGHYDADSQWHTDSEHQTVQDAHARTTELNREDNE